MGGGRQREGSLSRPTRLQTPHASGSLVAERGGEGSVTPPSGFDQAEGRGCWESDGLRRRSPRAPEEPGGEEAPGENMSTRVRVHSAHVKTLMMSELLHGWEATKP